MSLTLDGINILLAEDEILLRELLVAHLEMRGAHIECASNGADAFEIFRSKSFDIVVTDIRMPGQDGIALLRRIRENHLKVTPVLMISGYSDYSEEQLKKLGANGVLFKPFGVQEFEKSIADVLMKN